MRNSRKRPSDAFSRAGCYPGSTCPVCVVSRPLSGLPCGILGADLDAKTGGPAFPLGGYTVGLNSLDSSLLDSLLIQGQVEYI